MNWNNTVIQKTVRNMQNMIQQRFNIHVIKVTLSKIYNLLLTSQIITFNENG
jgi:hypothetical protein